MAGEFDGKVVVVTGAGRGLGRAHAKAFAARGAQVVVNDLGGAIDGTGSGATAQAVVDEIVADGGTAVANTASVADEQAAESIVADTISTFGRIDVLVNNAGILRDKTFRNLTPANFRAVVDVHLMGSVYVTHAAWPHMLAQGWGRVVFVSSSSAIFGNFGQSNYAAAKMSLIGLMNVLKLEGARKGVRVNTVAPGAITRMTENLTPARTGRPDQVSPAVLYLCSEAAPNGVILQAEAGRFRLLKVCATEGLDLGDEVTFESFADEADALFNDSVFSD